MPASIQHGSRATPDTRRTGPSGDYRPFGMRMRELREARGISLRAFAQQVGLSNGYLSLVERGEAWPPAEDKVKEIAAALDEDPDELLALAGRVATDLMDLIRSNPKLIPRMLRDLGTLRPEQIEQLASQVAQEARREAEPTFSAG